MAKSKGSGIRIRPQGSQSIDKMDGLKKKMLKALESGESVVLDFSRVTDSSLPFLQFVVASRLQAEKAGASFSFEGELSERLQRDFLVSGLTDKLCATGGALQKDLFD